MIKTIRPHSLYLACMCIDIRLNLFLKFNIMSTPITANGKARLRDFFAVKLINLIALTVLSCGALASDNI